MKSGPLTKPSGSSCDDEQLLWMSLKILEQGEGRFLLESNTEVQRKQGHHKAGSCFPHISSSVLWILVKLGTHGKLFSRGIQRHRLREIWEELAEDVRYYQKLTQWSRSRILVPSFFGTSVLVARPSTLAVLLQF